MKVIYNKIIPFKGFKCINLFGILFVREGCTMTDEDLNHEAIHTAQMKEMLYVLFYIWYVIEWLLKLCSYYKISFEREAYDNQADLEYLNNRKHYSWLKRIKS